MRPRIVRKAQADESAMNFEGMRALFGTFFASWEQTYENSSSETV
jgi:hypothetical protein